MFKHKFAKTLILLSAFICITPAIASVCFLPDKGCGIKPVVISDDEENTGENTDDNQDADCSGDYNLTSAKSEDRGWTCELCQDSRGTHYKCEAKDCPEGYIAGLSDCSDHLHPEGWSLSGIDRAMSGGRYCLKCVHRGCSGGSAVNPQCGTDEIAQELLEYSGDDSCKICVSNICPNGEQRLDQIICTDGRIPKRTINTTYAGNECFICASYNKLCPVGESTCTGLVCDANEKPKFTYHSTSEDAACCVCANNECPEGEIPLGDQSCANYQLTGNTTEAGSECVKCLGTSN